MTMQCKAYNDRIGSCRGCALKFTSYIAFKIDNNSNKRACHPKANALLVMSVLPGTIALNVLSRECVLKTVCEIRVGTRWDR